MSSRFRSVVCLICYSCICITQTRCLWSAAKAVGSTCGVTLCCWAHGTWLLGSTGNFFLRKYMLGQSLVLIYPLQGRRLTTVPATVHVVLDGLQNCYCLKKPSPISKRIKKQQPPVRKEMLYATFQQPSYLSFGPASVSFRSGECPCPPILFGSLPRPLHYCWVL